MKKYECIKSYNGDDLGTIYNELDRPWWFKNHSNIKHFIEHSTRYAKIYFKEIQQKNQIPEYVELLPNFDDKYTGKIFNIKKDSQPLGWGYKSWEWLIQDVHKKYFKPSTKSAYDAQFAKSTLTGSQILNLGDKPVDVTKEWLLAEAKRRYPVGTKYRAIGGGEFISEGQAYFYSKFEHGCSGNINIAVSFPENMRGLVYQDGKWAEIISTPEKKAEIPWTVGGWVRLTKDFKYKGNDYKKGEYHQITAVSKSVNPSVINFKYTDNLGNTLKVEAYTQFSTQTPECEWIGMNQPSWYEEQDRLVTERIKNFNIFIGYNATSDSYENKQPELFKKNKGTSVEVLPLQKPYVPFYKKSKHNNLIKI